MLAAVVSGIILHKHLLRDLFVAPRFSSLLLNRRDRHILAGSWSLPFGFLLAFTGAFFSFAGALGFPIVAMVSFGGDQVKMIETLVGVPEAESGAPAEMTNIDTILAKSAQRVGTSPDFVSVVHWGTEDAKMQVYHLPSGNGIESHNEIYDMVTGEYEGTKPDLGTRPSLGSAVFSWMGPLHFGHFAGLLSKFVWVSLGLAVCYVTLSGLQLWVQRRQGLATWRRLWRAIPIVGYGVPIGLAGAAIGFLAAFPAGDTGYWTPFGFLAGSAAVLIAGLVVKDREQLSRIYLFALGGSMAALPILRLAMGGTGWPTLFASANLITVMMDMLFLVGGGLVLALAAGWRPFARPAPEMPMATTDAEVVPAE